MHERRFGDVGVERYALPTGPKKRTVMWVKANEVMVIASDDPDDLWSPGKMIWSMRTTEWVDLVSTEVIE